MHLFTGIFKFGPTIYDKLDHTVHIGALQFALAATIIVGAMLKMVPEECGT